ncbi:DUF3224 domain-containing protein [Undibacterium sp. TJN19]|uniref:DUF3224 domain-containing protein n=1 Tax=Undibacterium sp. TJN19 TaxID=3413055 RepID=UPI003BF1AB44
MTAKIHRLATYAIVLFSFAWQAAAQAQITLKEGSKMSVTGTFEVKLSPQPAAASIAAANLGRQTIDKQFHGELEAHSLGEMIAAGTATKGSAGYVAIERVTGSLQGKKGTFILMHTGVMNRGIPQLTVQVVPDSGTEELLGISGQMRIQITNGQHFYTFDYQLP